MFAEIPADTEEITAATIGAAIEVHRVLGAGFLERIYQDALCYELCAMGIPFEREKAIAVRYKELPIVGQRLDLVVAERVVVELKAVAKVDASYEAKLISYLRTTGLRLGLLLNFNAPTMRAGLKRIVV